MVARNSAPDAAVAAEHHDILDNDLRPHEPGSRRLAAVRNELRDGPARVGHDDLFSQPDAPKEMREEVTSVPGVVLGKLAWRGVARWRGLATPPEESLQHAGDCERQPDTGLCEMSADLVTRLAEAEIGATYNQYADSEVRRTRLRAYLVARADAPFVLVGESAGYRGARVSGLAFTSERQLTGEGPAEASATIVHRVLHELGVEGDVLLWNTVPTHPGTATSNRRPTRDEIEASRPFLAEVVRGRTAIAVGRLAEAALAGAPYVRHPSRGGATAFARGLESVLFRYTPPSADVLSAPFSA